MLSRAGIFLIVAAALLPAAASATHLVEVEGSGDCNGWSVDATVEWRSGIYEGVLDYVITLIDGDGTELETFTWSGPISREVGDPKFMDYVFTDLWTVWAPGGEFTIRSVLHLVSPYGAGGMDDETLDDESIFDCLVVENETTSWSAIKRLYK